MTGVFERLDDVRESMRQLRRDLNAPNHYFDPAEVSRKVAERVERTTEVEVAAETRKQTAER